MLRAGAVGPLLRRPVDADQHRLGAGDLAGREHDLGDGESEVTAGEIEEGIAEVDLHDAGVDPHRVQLERRWDRRAVAGLELAGVGTADQFGQQCLGIVVGVAPDGAQRLLGAVGRQQVDAVRSASCTAGRRGRRGLRLLQIGGDVPRRRVGLDRATAGEQQRRRGASRHDSSAETGGGRRHAAPSTPSPSGVPSSSPGGSAT